MPYWLMTEPLGINVASGFLVLSSGLRDSLPRAFLMGAFPVGILFAGAFFVILAPMLAFGFVGTAFAAAVFFGALSFAIFFGALRPRFEAFTGAGAGGLASDGLALAARAGCLRRGCTGGKGGDLYEVIVGKKSLLTDSCDE
jgi:hypothetical protein